MPPGTLVARFALRTADVSDPHDDNDLVVVQPDNKSFFSGSSTSDEALQFVDPAPGDYKVCVLAFAGTAPMKHRLSSWIVGPGDGAGLKLLTPTTVYTGGTATLGLSWSGLSTGKRYVGGVQYLDLSGRAVATNAVRVDTDGAVPVLNEPPLTAAAKLAARRAKLQAKN